MPVGCCCVGETGLKLKLWFMHIAAGSLLDMVGVMAGGAPGRTRPAGFLSGARGAGSLVGWNRGVGKASSPGLLVFSCCARIVGAGDAPAGSAPDAQGPRMSCSSPLQIVCIAGVVLPAVLRSADPGAAQLASATGAAVIAVSWARGTAPSAPGAGLRLSGNPSPSSMLASTSRMPACCGCCAVISWLAACEALLDPAEIASDPAGWPAVTSSDAAELDLPPFSSCTMWICSSATRSTCFRTERSLCSSASSSCFS